MESYKAEVIRQGVGFSIVSFGKDRAKMGKFISYIVNIKGFYSIRKNQLLRNLMNCVLSDYFTSTRDPEACKFLTLTEMCNFLKQLLLLA